MFPVSKVDYKHLIHGPNRVSATIVSRFSESTPFVGAGPQYPATVAAAPFPAGAARPALGRRGTSPDDGFRQATSGLNLCQAVSLLPAQPQSVPRLASSSSSAARR